MCKARIEKEIEEWKAISAPTATDLETKEIRLAELQRELGVNTETPEQRRKRLKARLREEKAKGTRAFLQVVAKEEGISPSRLKQLTSADSAPTGGQALPAP
ncbi:MAG: hypothetical protein ACT4O2_00450 [Beijerinckiaceae bacterium]